MVITEMAITIITMHLEGEKLSGSQEQNSFAPMYHQVLPTPSGGTVTNSSNYLSQKKKKKRKIGQKILPARRKLLIKGKQGMSSSGHMLRSFSIIQLVKIHCSTTKDYQSKFQKKTDQVLWHLTVQRSFSDSSRVKKDRFHNSLCCSKGWPKGMGPGPGYTCGYTCEWKQEETESWELVTGLWSASALQARKS